MNKAEIGRVLAILEVAYPNYFKELDATKKYAMGVLWERNFKEIPADIMFVAVDEWISKNKFPPSVAEIKDRLVGMYWDSFAYMNAIKYDTLILSEADKKWVLYVADSLSMFNRREEPKFFPEKDETKLLR